MNYYQKYYLLFFFFSQLLGVAIGQENRDSVSTIPISGAEEIEQKYGFTNSNYASHLFTPTAISLRKGEGYYQNIWVTTNVVNYGLSDHVSIRGGVELISTIGTILGGLEGALLFADFKVGTQVSENVYLAGGVMGGAMLGEEFDRIQAALGYSLLTYGNKEHNFTLGIAYGAIGKKQTKPPVLIFGGMTRLTPKLGLVTENWLFNFQQLGTRNFRHPITQTFIEVDEVTKTIIPIFSTALRVMKEKTTFDFGLFYGGDHNRYIYVENGTSKRKTRLNWLPFPIPYIDFSYHF